MANAPERMQKRHVREKAIIDHLVQDVYRPKPVDENALDIAPPRQAACRSRIRFARNRTREGRRPSGLFDGIDFKP